MLYLSRPTASVVSPSEEAPACSAPQECIYIAAIASLTSQTASNIRKASTASSANRGTLSPTETVCTRVPLCPYRTKPGALASGPFYSIPSLSNQARHDVSVCSAHGANRPTTMGQLVQPLLHSEQDLPQQQHSSEESLAAKEEGYGLNPPLHMHKHPQSKWKPSPPLQTDLSSEQSLRFC